MAEKKHFGIFIFIASFVVVGIAMWAYYGMWVLMAVPQLLGSALTLALVVDIVWLGLMGKMVFMRRIKRVVFQSIATALVISILLLILGGKDILHLG